MEEVTASAVVRRPPEAVYDLLADVPGYADYSDYLRSIEREGDGGPDAGYVLSFSWRLVRWDVRARVTELDPPSRIAFDLLDPRGEGEWTIETAPERAPGGGPASRVRLRVRCDPDVSADLPALLPLDAVVRRVAPLAEREAERVARRAVADLEGTPREVDLAVEFA